MLAWMFLNINISYVDSHGWSEYLMWVILPHVDVLKCFAWACRLIWRSKISAKYTLPGLELDLFLKWVIEKVGPFSISVSVLIVIMQIFLCRYKLCYLTSLYLGFNTLLISSYLMNVFFNGSVTPHLTSPLLSSTRCSVCRPSQKPRQPRSEECYICHSSRAHFRPRFFCPS